MANFMSHTKSNMYIHTPFCRDRIILFRYVLVFIGPHMDIELEDNKQFISNTPCICSCSGWLFDGSPSELNYFDSYI